MSHTIGSHSDDRGGDSDFPCYCDDVSKLPCHRNAADWCEVHNHEYYATDSQGITPKHRTNYGLKSKLVQSPSETQLTLQKKAIERFAGKKCKEFEPHCFACMAWEVLPSWLENEHNTLFTQALTSLKSEMEILKQQVGLPEYGYETDTPLLEVSGMKKGISECQRVIDTKLEELK